MSRGGRLSIRLASLALVALIAPGPAGATGGLILRVLEANAEQATGELSLYGQNFTRSERDSVFVTLAGELLTLTGVSPTEIRALLPPGIAPGTYRLVVVRQGLLPGADAMDLTLGAAGPEGPPGADGERGEPGAPGVQGPPGEDGEDGQDGAPGPAGLAWRGAWDPATTYAVDDAVGFEGASWVALRDSAGVLPEEGADWSLLAARGEPGAQGETGERGEAGERGEQGAPGPQGLPGPAGADGEDGKPGPAGPPGLTWRGPWDEGAEYATDDAVAFEGSSWIALLENRATPPDDGGEAWSLVASRGATGEPGVQGERGPRGFPGEPGEKGDKGDAGEKGEKGDKGDTGDPGPIGPQGPAGDALVDRVVVDASGAHDVTTVSAALATRTPGPSTPLVVYIMPGDYPETVVMKSHVRLEGAGRGQVTLGGVLLDQVTDATITGLTFRRDVSADINPCGASIAVCDIASSAVIRDVAVDNSSGAYKRAVEARLSTTRILDSDFGVFRDEFAILSMSAALHVERSSFDSRGVRSENFQGPGDASSSPLVVLESHFRSEALESDGNWPVRFIGNEVLFGAGDGGVGVKVAGWARIADNTIRGEFSTAILVSGNTYEIVQIVGNEIAGAMHCVDLAGDATVVGNVLSNCDVGLNALSSRASIMANRFEENQFAYQGNERVSLTANVFKDNVSAARQALGLATLVGNHFENSPLKDSGYPCEQGVLIGNTGAQLLEPTDCHFKGFIDRIAALEAEDAALRDRVTALETALADLQPLLAAVRLEGSSLVLESQEVRLQSPLGGQLSVGPGSTMIAPSGFAVEAGNLRVEATLLDLFGDVVRIGGTGGAPAARAGDAVAGGEITSGSARVLIE